MKIAYALIPAIALSAAACQKTLPQLGGAAGESDVSSITITSPDKSKFVTNVADVELKKKLEAQLTGYELSIEPEAKPACKLDFTSAARKFGDAIKEKVKKGCAYTLTLNIGETSSAPIMGGRDGGMDFVPQLNSAQVYFSGTKELSAEETAKAGPELKIKIDVAVTTAGRVAGFAGTASVESSSTTDLSIEVNPVGSDAQNVKALLESAADDVAKIDAETANEAKSSRIGNFNQKFATSTIGGRATVVEIQNDMSKHVLLEATPKAGTKLNIILSGPAVEASLATLKIGASVDFTGQNVKYSAAGKVAARAENFKIIGVFK